MQGRVIVCQACGKELEYHPEEPPCEGLSGWVTVSLWKGREAVDHYSFCSLPCLQMWARAQSPQIPDVFLKSFESDAE